MLTVYYLLGFDPAAFTSFDSIGRMLTVPKTFATGLFPRTVSRVKKGRRNFRRREALGQGKTHQIKWLIELNFGSKEGETLAKLPPITINYERLIRKNYIKQGKTQLHLMWQYLSSQGPLGAVGKLCKRVKSKMHSCTFKTCSWSPTILQKEDSLKLASGS